ncbi:VirB10/TraB/TrbI family type IV secretion system protein [Klebsiella pneumoniae]
MSDEQKPKTPAEIERDSASRDKNLNPQEPEIEEMPEPDTEEVPEPEIEEMPEPETEEVQGSQVKPKTAAQIERDRLASLTAKSAPEPESETASSTTDNLDAVEDEMTAGKIEAALLKKRQEESRIQAAEDEPKKNKAGWLGIHNLKKTWKGRLIIAVVFILILLLFGVYNFPNMFRGMFGQKETVAKVDENSQGAGASKRLTGLNQDAAFDEKDDEQAGDTGTGKGDSGAKGNSDRSSAPPAPVVFSRALAQGMSSSSGASQDNSSHAGRDSDESDATPASGADVVPTGDNASHKKGLSAIKVLPYDPNLFIPENTGIPCSLDRRFVSDLSGKLTCTINDDIYSANGNVKLIEKGTKASLVYKTGRLKQGQGRAFLIATKLRTRKQPFMDIPLVDSEAAGALGEAGVDGWIDTHFWERFGGAMMLGMIPDAMQGLSGAARNNKDNQSDYTSNSREAFAEIAKEAFANSVNIPPTMYKNQGEIITLITGQDLDFSGVYRLKMRK